MKYLHHFQAYFEHEFALGGGSGDSGGFLFYTMNFEHQS
jgi:hypothetical protein